MLKYSDISPRTTAYADRRLLTRAVPNNILGQFGDVRELPSKSSKTIIVRRYNKLAPALTPLMEGVTPSGSTRTKTDYTVSVQQFGDWVGYSDVIQDTHEDPILKDNVDALGEQAAETYDILRAGVLKAGTNVLFTNGTQRSDVNTVISRALLRTAIRILKRQEAKPLRGIIKAGPNISTTPIPAAFIIVCHADLQPDFENLNVTEAGCWTPVHKYANTGGLINGEIGSVGEFRVVIDNNLTPWPDAGGAAITNGLLSTTGTSCDVYPIIILGDHCWAQVPLGGKNGVSTYVNNPKAITGDELAQRGSVGWKGWHAALITQDLWMLRIEAGAKG